MFNKINLSDRNRVFVVGDIHGEFNLFDAQLDKFGFNPDTDAVLSVGDLVDRGPDSQKALDYLDKSWFHAIAGNHEDMTVIAGGSDWHVMNGGQWFNDLSPSMQVMFQDTFAALPLAIEALLPSGKRVGICHAAFPASKQDGNKFITDWNDVQQAVQKTDFYGNRTIQWDRDPIGRAKKHLSRLHKLDADANALREFNIANIDHVYFGHTPIKEPFTIGNCTWLDTGAFATGNLTVLEIS